jgi:hypothetical protein
MLTLLQITVHCTVVWSEVVEGGLVGTGLVFCLVRDSGNGLDCSMEARCRILIYWFLFISIGQYSEYSSMVFYIS